ncbi:hypothetical protein C8R46DRAFT_1217834 [Mycena filopes]|nr:hypothetical protein C8R46DRAFT_1217834 [Mycena filopes]
MEREAGGRGNHNFVVSVFGCCLSVLCHSLPVVQTRSQTQQGIAATMPPKAKARKRVDKRDRRSLRLWAEGIRETILKPHIAPYTDALDRNWRAERDYAEAVYSEFHARISWRLEDHEEPDLPLPDYDPRAPAPEEDLTDDEMVLKRQRMAILNGRIRRWLKYRARKLRKTLHSKIDPLKDPWAVFLAKLSGLKAPPKARQAFQQFMHEVYATEIAPIVAERWAQQSSEGSNLQNDASPKADFRAAVARELFLELPEAERAGYQARAKEEAAAARKKFEEKMNAAPSRAPADRQRCIDDVGNFLGPILQGIGDRTGLHSVVLLGGPMPKYDGDLRTLFVSYGRSKAVGGLHFPEWADDRWDRQVTSLMEEYLRSAFTPQDVLEAALPNPLEGAKYTMEERDSPDNSSDSDSDSSSDQSSDSNEDSDDEPETKKRKRATSAKRAAPKTKGKAAARTSGLPEGLVGLSIEEIIAQTLKAPGVVVTVKSARNSILLEPLRTEINEELRGLGIGKKKAAPRAGKRAQVAGDEGGEEGTSSTARKSRRLNPAEEGEEMVDGASSDAPPPPPPPTNGPAADAPPPPPPPANGLAAADTRLLNATPDAPPPPPRLPTAAGKTGGGKKRGKKGKVVSTAAELDPTAVEIPEDAPRWIKDNIAWLSRTDLGVHYASLLTALVRAEKAFGFDEETYGALPLEGRPKQVTAWIGAGRTRTKKIPAVNDVGAYADGWYAWWDSLQPAWRAKDREGRWKYGGDVKYGDDEEWGYLDRPGPNGSLSVVAGLYFWGVCEEQPVAVKERWAEAVQDVVWMLEGLTQSMSKSNGGGKRGGRK